MVYTVNEYAKRFKFAGKFVSAKTVKRRCRNGMLPRNHIPKKLYGKTGSWIIEVKDE